MTDGNARVVEYVLKERLDRLPEAVLAQGRRCLLDLAGATLAGCRARGAAILTEFVLASMAGAPEAAVLRSGRRVPAPSAALANGFMTNALDIDDGYRAIVGHPGAVLFPAILAVAERQGATGAALLEALVVGYEVGIRAGLVMRPHYGLFHCSGSWGAIGAAAACGRLLGLDAGRLAHALGIAEAHAPLLPTLREVAHPAMTKDGVAWGAFVGVSAALLAERGFTALPSVFGDERSDAPVATLGERYEILHVYFKPYPCCRWFQPAIHGVTTLVGRHAIRPERIARIEVATFRAALDARVRAPRSQEEAEYSLPYCVAAVAVHGELGPRQVSEGGWEDPRVLDLARLIRQLAQLRNLVTHLRGIIRQRDSIEHALKALTLEVFHLFQVFDIRQLWRRFAGQLTRPFQVVFQPSGPVFQRMPERVGARRETALVERHQESYRAGMRIVAHRRCLLTLLLHKPRHIAIQLILRPINRKLYGVRDALGENFAGRPSAIGLAVGKMHHRLFGSAQVEGRAPLIHCLVNRANVGEGIWVE